LAVIFSIIQKKNIRVLPFLIFSLIVILISLYTTNFFPFKIYIIIFPAFFMVGSLFLYFEKRINYNIYLFIISLLILIFILQTEYVNLFYKKIFLLFLIPYSILYLAFKKSIFNFWGKYGDFSYGIYIYGYVIQQFVFEFVPLRNGYLNFSISYPITILVAILSYHLVEKRFMKSKIQLVD
jgi:peptidoglycan/LPS O-acetylase OafA/YrhL